MTPAKKYSDSPEDAFRRITRGLIAWRESTTVAMALIYEAIEREIWKLKYDSVKEYFELECHITERWGHELYAASKAIQGLNSVQPKSGISLGFLAELNPNNVGPVVNETPEKAAEILTRAKKKRGKKKITKKAVQEAKTEVEADEQAKKDAEAYMGTPAAPIVVKDCEGTPITEFSMPFWNRRQEVQDLMTAISKIKSKVEKFKADEDPMFRVVSNGCIAELGQAYAHISEALPYAVCTDCNGWPMVRVNGCDTCKSTGLISKFRWRTVSREEVKAIRARANAQL